MDYDLPMITYIIATITKDGFIARDPKEASTNWTSGADTLWFLKKTKESGIVVMGRKSYETIPDKYRPLKERINIVMTRDGMNDVDQISSLISNVKVQMSNEGQNLKSKLELRVCLDPKEIIKTVENVGFKELAVCGGSSVYTSFLKAGVVDQMYITVEENVEFGDGIPLFNDGTSLDDDRFELVREERIGEGTVVREYRVGK